MYKIIAFRPNGNYEVYERSSKKEAKLLKKELLNTHCYLQVFVKNSK